MRTDRFWFAVVLSTALYAVPLVAMACWMPITLAELLDPFGNSDREGFNVETIALEPGAWREGNQHTPGGDDLPELKSDDPPPEEQPMPIQAEPEVPPPLPAAAPLPEPKAKSPPARPTTAEQPKPGGLAGASGGANMGIGTPSRGGQVGVPHGFGRIGSSEPPYPAEALRHGWEGRPVVEVLVSTEGKVIEAKMLKPCKHEVLNKAALRWAQSLRFRPSRIGTEPVETTVQIPVKYEIESHYGN